SPSTKPGAIQSVDTANQPEPPKSGSDTQYLPSSAPVIEPTRDGGGDMKEQLGRRLRATREEQKLSLRAVASAIGVSPSMLSQVETGKIHPSVTTLYALVSHLNVSLDELLGIVPSDAAPTAALREIQRLGVQRAEANPTIEMENGVTWERLANAGHRGVDPLIMTYEPGASSSAEGKLMRHSGTEYGYLIEGELTLLLDFDSFTLHVGDSICFDSHRPHLYRNDTDRAARGIWFVTGPLGESPLQFDGQPAPAHINRLQSVRQVLRQDDTIIPPRA
ncbi:helix-turn-helix domain-containing protein, partial [Microbacterium sp. C448]